MNLSFTACRGKPAAVAADAEGRKDVRMSRGTHVKPGCRGGVTIGKTPTHPRPLVSGRVWIYDRCGYAGFEVDANFTSGQVARFFGVSISTIHNWIEQKRLIGVTKGARNKQVRIPETAVYVSPVGEKIMISETAELYKAEQKRLGSDRTMTAEEELEELRKEVAYYEQKYGGSYEETFGKRTVFTLEEERDAGQWASLLRSIERRRTRS